MEVEINLIEPTAGNAVTNGIPLGISDSDLVFNFSPNVFKISPLYSDLPNNGMWMYELTIDSDIGNNSITIKISNNPEFKISHGVYEFGSNDWE